MRITLPDNIKSSAFASILLAIAVLLGTLLLSQGLIVVFSFFGLYDLTELQLLFTEKVPSLSDKQRAILLFIQGFSQLTTWGLTSWLMIRWCDLPLPIFDKPILKLHLVVASIILLMVSIPFVQLITLNPDHFHLPKLLSRLENFLTDQDESKSQLIQSLLQTDSPLFLGLNLVVMALLPAICEELLFRGFLQQILKRNLTSWQAILWSGFIFSVIHFQFMGFFARFVLGILLGYIFEKTNSLIYNILAHFAFNATTIIAVYYVVKAKTNFDVENYEPPFWVGLVSLGLVVVVGYFLDLRRSEKTF